MCWNSLMMFGCSYFWVCLVFTLGAGASTLGDVSFIFAVSVVVIVVFGDRVVSIVGPGFELVVSSGCPSISFLVFVALLKTSASLLRCCKVGSSIFSSDFGDGFLRARINCLAAVVAFSVDNGYGSLQCFGKNSTVSDTHCAFYFSYADAMGTIMTHCQFKVPSFHTMEVQTGVFVWWYKHYGLCSQWQHGCLGVIKDVI